MKYSLSQTKITIKTIFSSEKTSLKRRVLIFMFVAVITMFFAVMAMLFLTDIISIDDEKITKQLNAEQYHLSQNLTKQMGNVSVQLILLSKNITSELETLLRNRNMSTLNFENQPEVINEVLSSLVFRLLFSLDNADCSGVFLVLNTTVNPNIPNAKFSRAGLYIREAEPAVLGAVYNKLFLRGPQEIAIKNGMIPQSKWDLEIDIKNRPFYNRPLEAYKKDPSVSLSRLYYWSFEEALSDANDNVLLCSIPLIDSNGNFLGVCGFEISSMHFMLNNDIFFDTNSKKIAMFSLADNAGLILKNALYAGNASIYNQMPNEGKMFFSGNSYGRSLYRMPTDSIMTGFSSEVNMYATGSPFSESIFSVTVAMMKEDIDILLSKKNMHLATILLVCLLFGVIISLILSKQHVKPILAKIEHIIGQEALSDTSINISEIDQLVAKLKESYGSSQVVLETENIFNDFIERVANLTPTEMVIFQYYAEGKTFDEIKALMFIATGTLKTHNTHIYNKLNVPSKDTLLLYVELIKKTGNYEKLFRD